MGHTLGTLLMAWQDMFRVLCKEGHPWHRWCLFWLFG